MEDNMEDSSVGEQMERRDSRLRFLVIILLCLMSSCFIFSYNSPGALQFDLMSQYNLNFFWFAVIYSAFYWPNILCFVGGYLVDRTLGVRYGTIIFVTISVLGSVLCALGAFLNNFWIMVIGRFFYGCAGDSVAVSLNLYAVLWFSGKELAMVMAMNQSFPMFGASLVYQIGHPLLTYVRQYTNSSNALGVTLLFISAATVISVFSAMILAIIYPKSKEELLNTDIIYRKEIIKFSDITSFPLQFWILCLLNDIYFNSVFTFVDLSQGFLLTKYGLDVNAANDVISSFSIISCLASPLLGILVNYTGRNISFAILSTLASLSAHFMAAFTLMNPYVLMFMVSMSHSLMVGSIWPLFSLMSGKHQQGSVYGLVMASMNATMAIGVLISGRIIDKFGYEAVEVYYLINLMFVVLLFGVVWILDTKRDGILNKSPSERLFSQKSLNRSVSMDSLH